MPLDTSVFPEEVQVAFFIFDMLPDRWEGMSGTYLGKEWSSVNYLLEIYEIDNPKVVMYFAKLYERITVNVKIEEAEKKRKAEERKSKASGGKNYTHNVRG